MHAQRNSVAAASTRSAWLPDHLAALHVAPDHFIPPIPADLPRPLLTGLDLWDMWPAQHPDGAVADFDGAALWFVLCAPQLADPDQRHGVARIRLLSERAGQWRDHGDAFPDGFTPGSREWAGSAVIEPGSNSLTLYFTAAGERGDGAVNWAQRIFSCTGELSTSDDTASISWRDPVEAIRADGIHYQRVDAHVGEPGFIKGFRDPAYFRDPLTSAEYLLFTASLVAASSRHDGAIGIAMRTGDGRWQLLPPLVSMDGVNNEPERPHIVYHQGHYYLFFSTQRRMFAPGIDAGPNGLYAMVASDMLGPYIPVNGSGLVAANPCSAPFQAYSWWVTPDLAVHGFADLIGEAAMDPVDSAAWRRAHFGGVPAPRFQLALADDRAHVIG